jgi:hypothetical protein
MRDGAATHCLVVWVLLLVLQLMAASEDGLATAIAVWLLFYMLLQHVWNRLYRVFSHSHVATEWQGMFAVRTGAEFAASASYLPQMYPSFTAPLKGGYVQSLMLSSETGTTSTWLMNNAGFSLTSLPGHVSSQEWWSEPNRSTAMLCNALL